MKGSTPPAWNKPGNGAALAVHTGHHFRLAVNFSGLRRVAITECRPHVVTFPPARPARRRRQRQHQDGNGRPSESTSGGCRAARRRVPWRANSFATCRLRARAARRGSATRPPIPRKAQAPQPRPTRRQLIPPYQSMEAESPSRTDPTAQRRTVTPETVSPCTAGPATPPKLFTTHPNTPPAHTQTPAAKQTPLPPNRVRVGLTARPLITPKTLQAADPASARTGRIYCRELEPHTHCETHTHPKSSAKEIQPPSVRTSRNHCAAASPSPPKPSAQQTPPAPKQAGSTAQEPPPHPSHACEPLPAAGPARPLTAQLNRTVLYCTADPTR